MTAFGSRVGRINGANGNGVGVGVGAVQAMRNAESKTQNVMRDDWFIMDKRCGSIG